MAQKGFLESTWMHDIVESALPVALTPFDVEQHFSGQVSKVVSFTQAKLSAVAPQILHLCGGVICKSDTAAHSKKLQGTHVDFTRMVFLKACKSSRERAVIV